MPRIYERAGEAFYNNNWQIGLYLSCARWLEESGEAESLQTLIDIKQIDELFLEFNSFVPELHKGMKLDWDLVHKAGQIIRKLDLVFESKKLGSFLDRSLLRRANRMLNDYTVTYRGFRPHLLCR